MKTTRTAYCSHPECREYVVHHYDSKKEARESTTNFKTWKCVRHSQPERVLSPTNTVRSVSAIASKSKFENLKDKLFWTGDGFLNSGFISGPGFKAFANDFPEGTKITVNVIVDIPR